ncbi:MAG: hypothetical protein NT166_22410 [Candidatus Aminicenantes bacterium]|nr:hypothetical protein [Candidatus Aminicenantes bacterium]
MVTLNKFYLPIALVLALGLGWTLGCQSAGKNISKEQAWDIVKKDILKEEPGNRVVYLNNTLLNAGQERKSWGDVHKVPANFRQAWLFFVDDQPDANWGHHCRYVFVDAETGKYHVSNSLNPPDSLEGMSQIYPPTGAEKQNVFKQ